MAERKSKLEEARRLRGWSLETASLKIGVHPQTLRRWETGKNKPHDSRVRKISEVYETTPAGLDLDWNYHHVPLTAFLSNDLGELEPFLATLAAFPLSIEELGLHLMALTLQRKVDRQNLNYAPFQLQIHQYIKEYDDYIRSQHTMLPANSLRQQTLRVVATMPITAHLEIIEKNPLPVPPEDILTHCASGIAVCWHMSQDEDLLLTSAFVSSYLILLTKIFESFVHCRLAAAELISQAYLFRTILSLQMQESQSSIKCYTSALEYSGIARDADGAMCAPILLSSLRHYGKQPAQALEKMANSLWLLKPIPAPADFSLIRDYIQRITEFYLAPGQLDARQRRSKPSSSDASEIDEFPISIDYAETALTLWDGVTHYELGEYIHALEDLLPTSHSEVVYDAPEQVRHEFLQNRALAALRLHDMSQAISSLRVALPEALSMGTEQELVKADEAYHILQFFQASESSTPGSDLKDLLKKHD